jgi:hypothetical protein
MRFMNIPPFRRKIEIPDFEFFVRTRLSQELVLWPEQAISLLGYMGWPNDLGARANAMRILRGGQKEPKIRCQGCVGLMALLFFGIGDKPAIPVPTCRGVQRIYEVVLGCDRPAARSGPQTSDLILYLCSREGELI